MRKPRRLADAYSFPGFRPLATVVGIFGNPRARVLQLQRRGKKRFVASAAKPAGPSTTGRFGGFALSSCGDTRVYLHLEIRRVACRNCAAVKQERLPWLADNPFYTQRFAYFVGRRCRASTLQDVARELHLDWKTVKELEKQYLREQLRRIGTPGPKGIGIDEIAIRKGHTYRIVVSDLIRRRPIWFGGQDRSEQSMDLFFQWLGPKKSRRIRLAVMDMWRAFRTSTLKEGHASQAAILYDKFHVARHLG